MKIIVTGHARHGKDTVCEFLRDLHGLAFVSSSWVCWEHAVYPLLKDKYASLQESYENRAQDREIAFQAIRDYNYADGGDGTRLARIIFETLGLDVYCGLRSADELEAIKAAGMVDHVIWVDASKRCPPEMDTSITITPDMCDYVVNNNEGLSYLRHWSIPCLARYLGLISGWGDAC